MEDRFQDAGLGHSHINLSKLNMPARWNSFTDSKNSNNSNSNSNSNSNNSNNNNNNNNNMPFASDRRFAAHKESKKPASHHKSRIHRRHHRHNPTHDTIQSAVQLPTQFSFDNYNPLKRSHHNQNHVKEKDKEKDKDSTPSSQDASRRNSSHIHLVHHAHHAHHPPPPDGANTTPAANGISDPGGSPSLSHPEAHPVATPLRRIIRPADIVTERKRRERRTEETADSLNALSRDAYTATRKLDDTYYALLERLGILRSTISSLQDLSGQASRARTAWEREVHVSAGQVTAKIEGFGGFAAQEHVVDSLVQRLRQTKTRAGELKHRLEGCRGRLEDFQRKEQQSRIKVDKRWRMCWCSLAALVLLVLGLLVWRHQRGELHLIGEFRGTGEALRDGAAELAVEVGVRRNRTKPGMRIVDAELERQQSSEEEKWKRVLDEL